MVVGAAMSCVSSSAVLNVQVARMQPPVASESSRLLLERGAFLRWDPLRSTAGLRASSSNSSSLNSSTSSWRSSRRSSLRASNLGKDEAESSRGNESVGEENSNGLAKLLSSAAKPALVAAVVALLAMQPSEDALAASSGGRVGGKVFSKPAPSRSYSGGGGGGGGGRSYSGGGGGGYGGGYYVAPPTYGFSPFGYSPLYGGGYGGGLYGPSIGFGGGGGIFLAMFAFATLSAVGRFVRNRFGNREEDEDRFDD